MWTKKNKNDIVYVVFDPDNWQPTNRYMDDVEIYMDIGIADTTSKYVFNVYPLKDKTFSLLLAAAIACIMVSHTLCSLHSIIINRNDKPPINYWARLNDLTITGCWRKALDQCWQTNIVG